jgi:hypothetical protein
VDFVRPLVAPFGEVTWPLFNCDSPANPALSPHTSVSGFEDIGHNLTNALDTKTKL